MATTYPLPTLAAVVTATGISAPTFADIYQSLQASFKTIYGTDSYIDPDSQDGQLLAVFAKAIGDSNDTAIAIWNSFSPATAQNQALSNNVRINGIARAVPTKGQVVLRIVGQIGAIITDGVAGDADQNRWLLPASVTIPPAGQIDVTATAEKVGEITALTGTITEIVTPTRGWQSVSNISPASPGAPVESDAALRQRQTVSTALPSQTVLNGTVGAIAAVVGVTQVVVYENDTNVVDANGIAPNSIAAVVLGGTAADIANAIMLHKTPGAFSFGSTVVVVNDPSTGIPYNIRYTPAGATPMAVAITIKARAGYSTTVGEAIKQSIADYINGLGIGARSDIGRLYLPAQFYGAYDSRKFDVDVLQQSIKPASPTAADVVIPYNSRATITTADITLTVT